MKITKLETFLIAPRWLFLRIHTDEGIVGLGEPYLEGRATTSAEAVKELEDYLIGQDPRRIIHHWEAMYRQPCYHGGAIMMSAISGVEAALWDILGKSVGLPVWQLLGGRARDRIRLYKGGGSIDQMKEDVARGFKGFKIGLPGPYPKVHATKEFIDQAVASVGEIRDAVGPSIDIAIDLHGAFLPAAAVPIIKALEPLHPAWIEDPCQCENYDEMARIAQSTSIPIAAGERVFTRWAFRELLERGAAKILNPDPCHVGGIFETRLIAGMAEMHYAGVAPHCPLGPIALATCLQLDAMMPNFVAQEHVTLGEGYLKEPFVPVDGYLPIPDKPGLGIELDDEAMADKIGAIFRPQSPLHHEDGTVVDW